MLYSTVYHQIFETLYNYQKLVVDMFGAKTN